MKALSYNGTKELASQATLDLVKQINFSTLAKVNFVNPYHTSGGIDDEVIAYRGIQLIQLAAQVRNVVGKVPASTIGCCTKQQLVKKFKQYSKPMHRAMPTVRFASQQPYLIDTVAFNYVKCNVVVSVHTAAPATDSHEFGYLAFEPVSKLENQFVEDFIAWSSGFDTSNRTYRIGYKRTEQLCKYAELHLTRSIVAS